MENDNNNDTGNNNNNEAPNSNPSLSHNSNPISSNSLDTHLQSLLSKASQIQHDHLLTPSSYCEFFLDNQWHVAYINRKTDDNKFELIFLFNKEMKTVTINKSSKLSLLRLHTTHYKKMTIRDPFIPYSSEELHSIKDCLIKCDQNPIEAFNTPYDIIQFYTGKIPEILDGLRSIQSFKNDDISLTAMEILLIIVKLICNVLSFASEHKEALMIIQKHRILMLIDKNYAYLLTLEVLCESFNRLISAEYKTAIYAKVVQSCDKLRKNFGMNDIETISNTTIATNEERKIICLIIDYFHMNNGISNVFELIIQSKSLPFDCIDKIIFSMKMLKMLISYKPFDNYHTKLVEYYINRIDSLNENELKELKKNSIIEYTKSILVIGNLPIPAINNQIEIIYYKFLYKCLLSQNLEKRIYAMNSINSIITNKTNSNGKKDTNDEDTIPFKSFEMLSQFIKEKNIFDVLLGENAHDELLKRSILLFRLFALKDQLSNEVYDLLWRGLTERHESVSLQIENVICEMALVLNENRLQLLFEKMKSYPIINVKILMFIQKFTQGCYKATNSLIQFKQEDDFYKCNQLYGLPLLWKYMQDDYECNTTINDDMTTTMQNNESNIKECIAGINSLLMISSVSNSVIIKVLGMCVENILSHQSIIQSLKLIKKICYERSKQARLFNEFSESYDIISIILKDLERYMTTITNNCVIDLNSIYEGFYTHEKNIHTRLKLIFFLVKIKNFNCFTLTKEHILNLWSIFTTGSNRIINITEQDLFFKHLQRNIEAFKQGTLEYFFNDILNNPSRFLYASINRYALFLYEYVFIEINKTSGALFNDKKNLRVKSNNIEGIDTLWKIVLSNPNEKVQERVCSFLCDLCLHLYDYSNDFISVYWNNFIEKLSRYYIEAHKENNSTGINGLISLTKKIYNEVSEEGKIPCQNDIEYAKGNMEQFSFQCPLKNNKQYNIKVGREENLFTVRWRLGYYYDLEINKIIFKQKNNRSATMLNDFTKFIRIFDHREIVQVTTIDVPLLSLNNNPRKLIEQNEVIFKILFNLLHHSNEKYIANAWELIQCLPENNVIQKQLKSLGQRDSNTNKIDLSDLMDLNSLYVVTYSLQLINKFIISNEWLMNFILNEGHVMIMKVFLSINFNSNHNTNIIYDCLNKVIPILKETISNIDLKSNEKIILCRKVMELIESNVKVSIAFDSNGNNTRSDSEIKYIERVEREFLEDENNKSDDDDSDEEDDENEGNINVWKIQSSVIKNLFDFTQGNSIKREFEECFFGLNEAYISNRKQLGQLYTIDYITLVNPFIKRELYVFISRVCDEDHTNTTTTMTDGEQHHLSIKAIFFETIFTMETLSFAKQSNHTGFYFNMLSSLLTKYIDISLIHIDLKQLCDINFISTIYNDNQIEGYMKLLLSLLNKAPALLKYIIEKYDVFNILLKKGILSKCENEPLTKNSPNCSSQRAQLSVYMVMVALCRYSPQLTEKVIGILNDYHHLGFWKTAHYINWRISLSYDRKAQYVGLKNLGCTCYMNSFIQQLFMIPQLRETFLSIPLNSSHGNNTINNEDTEMHDDSKYTNCLYQLQNIFAGLKAYESQYYNPKDLCLNFDGEILDIREQMDAEEFFSRLIDKLENRLKDYESYRNIFKYFFGGKNVDELIFKGCIHKRENEFYYNSIQLQVAGKKNLIESLDSYIQGEMMEGNNAIYCEKCEKKIPALKRQTFKIFPKKLILVLKRFEFDYDNMVKYKLNNYFEFPTVLNMAPYAQVIPNEAVEYDLTGFIIHVGFSDSGHYYSIIKEENSDEGGKWYEFNDTNVKEFDIDNLENEAFGGFEDEIDNDGKKKTVEKNMNAYVLIYTKRILDSNTNEELFPTKIFPLNQITSLSNIPNDIMDKINNDMFQYWVLKNISSNQYQRFIKELLKQSKLFTNPHFDIQCRNTNVEPHYDPMSKLPFNLRAKGTISSNLRLKEHTIPISTEEDIPISHEANLFTFGCLFFFNVVLRYKETYQLAEFTDIIKAYINDDINNARWLIEEFSTIDTLKEFLIECPIALCKKISVGLIYCALLKINNAKNAGEINSNDKDLIVNFTKVILHVIIIQSDMDFIWMILYRIIVIYKDILKPLLDKVAFIDFGWEYYCVSKKNSLMKLAKITSESLSIVIQQHHILSDRNSTKIERLTSFEESLEKKSHEKLLANRNDRYLFNIMTLFISEEDITNERIIDLLSNLRTKSSAINLSKTIIFYTKNNQSRSKMITESLISYIKAYDVGMLEWPLLVCRRFLFKDIYHNNNNDPLSINRISLFFAMLYGIIKDSLSFYSFIEYMAEFLIKCHTYHMEKLQQSAKNNINQIASIIYSFFNENKYPPKFYPSNKVRMYKEDSYTFPKNISSEILKSFEENYDIKRKEYQIRLAQVYRNEKIKGEYSYDSDEDLTDFKFTVDDKVKYDNFNCRIIGTLDEIIHIEYNKDEIERTKRPRNEWIETDARNLVISELTKANDDNNNNNHNHNNTIQLSQSPSASPSTSSQFHS